MKHFQRTASFLAVVAITLVASSVLFSGLQPALGAALTVKYSQDLNTLVVGVPFTATVQVFEVQAGDLLNHIFLTTVDFSLSNPVTGPVGLVAPLITNAGGRIEYVPPSSDLTLQGDGILYQFDITPLFPGTMPIGGSAIASTTAETASLEDNWGLFDATVAPVPIPTTVWLFGSALGLLGWMRRRKKA